MCLKHLNNKISNCRKCNLYKTRTNTVPGDGNPNTDILFIGEAPGRNEDLKGKPFVGKAGQVLDKLLESIGLDREDIFIANILKCRPPDNRNPLIGEIKLCTAFLDKQIQIIQPKVIVPMGNFASSYILDKYGLKKDSISMIHGKKFDVKTLSGKMAIIPIFHPAVVTYDKNKMVEMLEDFKKISEYIKS
jgi:DNA polymerase